MEGPVILRSLMRYQPAWPIPYREPDKITDITGGGFVDGTGTKFHVPVSLNGLDVSLEKDTTGQWYWVGRKVA